MSLKKRVGGDAWVGASVEVYWETTKTWERGKVVAFNFPRDEYKVQYEGNAELESHWESPGDALRFPDPALEEQRKSLLKKDSKAEAAIIEELLDSEEDVETWLPKFVHKLYTFFLKDKTRVLQMLSTDSKIDDDAPEFLVEKPFPLVQKLDRIKRVVDDENTVKKVQDILLDDERYPIAKRRGAVRQIEEQERKRVSLRRRTGGDKEPSKDLDEKGRKNNADSDDDEDEEGDEDNAPHSLGSLAKRRGRPPAKGRSSALEPVLPMELPTAVNTRSNRVAQTVVENQKRILEQYEKRKLRQQKESKNFDKEDEEKKGEDSDEEQDESSLIDEEESGSGSESDPDMSGSESNFSSSESGSEEGSSSAEELSPISVRRKVPRVNYRVDHSPIMRRLLRARDKDDEAEEKPEPESFKAEKTPSKRTPQKRIVVEIEEDEEPNDLMEVDGDTPQRRLTRSTLDLGGASTGELALPPRHYKPRTLTVTPKKETSPETPTKVESETIVVVPFALQPRSPKGLTTSEPRSPKAAAMVPLPPAAEIQIEPIVREEKITELKFNRPEIDGAYEDSGALQESAKRKPGRPGRKRKVDMDNAESPDTPNPGEDPTFKPPKPSSGRKMPDAELLAAAELERPKRNRIPRKEFDEAYEEPKSREGNGKRGKKRDRDEEDDDFVDLPSKRRRFDGEPQSSQPQPQPPIVTSPPQVHYAPVGTTLTDDASFLASFLLNASKPESSAPTFSQRLNDAKSLVPAKKIWVLHSHRHNAQEWDLYLCQGPRLVNKQGAYLVRLGASPSCTCEDFTKNHSPCCHLVFAYVVIFNVAETESELLQSSELSSEQLARVFEGAPSETSTFPRLAPVNITRLFYSWFDPSVLESTRHSAFMSMLAKDQLPSASALVANANASSVAADPFSFPMQSATLAPQSSSPSPLVPASSIPEIVELTETRSPGRLNRSVSSLPQAPPVDEAMAQLMKF